MKKSLPIALVSLALGFALSTVAARPTVQDDKGADARISALEVALAKEQKAHAETRALVDQTVEYLQAVSESAKQMMTALDQAEAAGFTAGINFHSREILLAGWRDVWSTAQKNVPTAKQATKPGVPPRR